MLEVKPSKVPDFVKLYKNQYMDRTRQWLKDNFNKGLAYIPANQFMETCDLRFNPPIGPSGYSIGYMSMLSGKDHHALICFNGGVLWDNGDERHDEYEVLKGYFVIYDLESPKAKPLPSFRKKRKKKSYKKAVVVKQPAKKDSPTKA